METSMKVEPNPIGSTTAAMFTQEQHLLIWVNSSQQDRRKKRKSISKKSVIVLIRVEAYPKDMSYLEMKGWTNRYFFCCNLQHTPRCLSRSCNKLPKGRLLFWRWDHHLSLTKWRKENICLRKNQERNGHRTNVLQCMLHPRVFSGGLFE